MANLLLLYDTNDSDIARDFRDLLTELNVGNVVMIPLSPDKTLTLEEKEQRNFKSADGALFIITPGSQRLGKLYPSPSVALEMGQAKTQFQNKPECVIYLVDDKCILPSIDQKPYISFKRDDIRSILSALIQLLKNIKSAGLFRTTPIPTQVQPQSKPFDINAFTKGLDRLVIDALFDISNKPKGLIDDKDLTALLAGTYKLTMQQINFLKRDLELFKVVTHSIATTPHYYDLWWLSDLGWSVVRLEADRKKKADQDAMKTLSSLLASGKGIFPAGGGSIFGGK